jgi:hypothetical protein
MQKPVSGCGHDGREWGPAGQSRVTPCRNEHEQTAQRERRGCGREYREEEQQIVNIADTVRITGMYGDAPVQGGPVKETQRCGKDVACCRRLNYAAGYGRCLHFNVDGTLILDAP